MILSTEALRTLNAGFVSDPTGNAAPDYLYALGGYETPFVETQLVVQNNQSFPVRITNIGVLKSCTAPLAGTLFYAPGQAGDPSVKIGFDLDSAYSVALQMQGMAINGSFPHYFANYTVSINPGAQQVFDLLAQTFHHACTFRYQVTVLEGGAKVDQIIGDGPQPFRVSGYITDQSGGKMEYSAYPVIYAGGPFSPAGDNSFVRVDPKTFGV